MSFADPAVVELALWAKSGAMDLTGLRDGPPVAAPGRPASTIARELTRLAASTEARTGVWAEVPDVSLLGERAAIMGLSRNGPFSCGGAFRTFPTADGWLGLTLARSSDWELLPALVEDASARDWTSVLTWARRRGTDEAAERARLLGLPVAHFRPSNRPGVIITHGPRRAMPERPFVLDLTALWAGPLCAHLLSRGGVRVLKVESTRRPDGTRRGAPEFFSLLHDRHEFLVLDFSRREDRERLAQMAASADLVLESSRADALPRLGLVAEEFVAAGISWLSISAEGRSSGAVGFGDDVAVGAGLFVSVGDQVVSCGDALADPLAGVVAAAAASAVLTGDRAALIDVSMRDVAWDSAQGATAPHAVARIKDQWWVDAGSRSFPVSQPSRRLS